LRPTGRALVGLGPATTKAQRHQVMIESRQTYALVAELRSRHLAPPAMEVDLRWSELKVFSQNGEDGILAALLHTIGDSPDFFVEFGVQDGSECNTRLLAEFLGWSGVYFEPDPASYATLRDRYRPGGRVISRPDPVTPSNVTALFEANGVPDRFGILSIDVDGQDYWIWRALDDRFRPDIVIIEYNSAFPYETARVEREGLPFEDIRCDTFGVSIEALRQLGDQKGYELVHCDATGLNAVFVAREQFSGKGRSAVGVTRRDPNYRLRGRGHRPEPVRPTVTPPPPGG
jgi:hypothetical protein